MIASVVSTDLSVAQRMTQITLKTLAPMRPTALPVREEFFNRIGERTPINLQFRRYSIDGIGELRWTSMASARADILALMIFPNDPEQLPIFAAEFVVIANRCRAAVVDFQSAAEKPSARERHVSWIEDVGQDYAPYRSPELPEWCAEYFTPHAIAALGVDLDSVNDLLIGYERYLGVWAQHALWTPPSHQRFSPSLSAYKSHHIDHTPGRPMMTAAYGAEWTERFLREGMYA